MAEALGFAASVIAVIQLTGAVTALGYNYIAGVKRAPNDMQQLVNELTSLGKVLEPKAGFKGVVENLKWPLKEHDTLQHIARLERHKNLFAVALTADQISLSKAIEAYVKNIDIATREIITYSENTTLALESLRKDVRFEFEAQTQCRQQEDKIIMAENYKKALDWIFPDSFDRKYHEISRRRQDQTGDWLLQEKSIKAWIMGDPNHRLLWGHGIPGAGKTFLSSRVIDHLLSQIPKQNLGVAYIYFEYQEQQNQKPDTILACLVKQLGLQIPQGVKEISDLHTKNKRPDFDDLYKALFSTFGTVKRVFFILDALDECHEENQREELLPLLQRLCGDGASVFITSRPHPEDIQGFAADSQAIKIELSAQEEDIVRYIKAVVDRKPRAKRLVNQGKFKDRIISELRDCANGMFLLVHFHITFLCQQTTAKQILKELDRIKNFSNEDRPLDPTYDRAMGNVRSQPRSGTELALKIFSWLIKARRTLAVDELRTAVSIEYERYELDELDLPDQMTLLDVCAGLVIIDKNDGFIRLAHYTVQEYLLRNKVIPHDTNFQVTATCITYLSFDFLAGGPCADAHSLENRLKSNPFLAYAVPQLPFHLASYDEKSSTDLILEFLRNPDMVGSYVQCLYDFRQDEALIKRYYPLLRRYPKLHAASTIGHCAAAQKFLAEGADWLVLDGINKSTPLAMADIEVRKRFIGPRLVNGVTGDTPLGLAVVGGHDSVVRLLIDHGADILGKSSRFTPLVLSMKYGHHLVSKTLLDNGSNLADLETTDGDGYTPLIQAVRIGHLALAKILLDYKADPSAMNKYGVSALMIAVAKGSEPTVKMLLSYGANPSAISKDGGTALLIAVHQGHESIVKMLIDDDRVDLSAVQKDGYNILLPAITTKNYKIFKLLIGNGANSPAIVNGRVETLIAVNLPNEELTMLMFAVGQGDEFIVRELLDHGADPSVMRSDGSTALTMAINMGNESIVKALLDHGANPSAIDKFGGDPVLLAVAVRKEPIVKILLSHGADPSATGRDGRTALMSAVLYEDESTVNMLLDHGADVSVADNIGCTAIMFAVTKKSDSLVKVLLDHGADTSAMDNKGDTTFFFAIHFREESRVKMLLNYRANASAANSDGGTPLMFAVGRGNESIVKVLLDHGADVSAVAKNGCTALMLAASMGNYILAKLLLDHGADASVIEKQGLDALLIAVSVGHEPTVKVLLDYGAIKPATNNKNTNPLILAVHQRKETIAKLLLDHGADISATDPLGNTALLFAALNGDESMVKLLLSYGADTSVTEGGGNTALLLAANYKNVSIVKVLLSHGADTLAANKNGNTALIFAVHQNEESMVKMLLDNGADPTVANLNGNTALTCVSGTGNEPIARILLDRGADLSAANNHRATALQLAAKNGHDLLVKLFLDKGADLSSADNDGHTALHEAALKGKLSTVKLLLDRGADATLENNSGKTPLMCAIDSGHQDVTRILVALSNS